MKAKHSKYLNNAKYEIWRDKYLAGATLAQIGSEYGVTRQRVQQVMAQFGISGKEMGRTRKVKVNTSHDKAIIALYKTQSKTFPVSRDKVYEILHRNNIPLRGRGVNDKRTKPKPKARSQSPIDRKLDPKQAAIKYRNTHSASQIARAVGVSRNAIIGLWHRNKGVE